jgi:uncharacterized protein DUF1236
MKLHLTTIAAIAAFASGIGAASAAGNHAMSSNSMTPAMQSKAKDTLSLTNSQERTAWRAMSRQAGNQTAPSNFTPSVGAKVPSDITLKPVPAKVAARVSPLKPYDYAVLQNKLLIVNPTDKKVVDVINRHA